MDIINNIEFREFLLSRIESKKRTLDVGPDNLWDIVTGQWGIEFVNGWGMKNNMGDVTIQHYDPVSSKVYSFTMESCYYNDIIQEFRQSKIDKILC